MPFLVWFEILINQRESTIQDAAEQSRNIVIDGRKSKLHPIKLKNEVQHQFNIIKKARRLIFINKSGKAVEIFRDK